MKTHARLFSFLARTGIAFAFLYAGVAGLMTPDNWVGFVPQMIRDAHTAESIATILMLWSCLEIALALWILSNKQLFASSMTAAVVLGLVILANITQIDIVFRDVPIFFSALAVAVLAKTEKHN